MSEFHVPASEQFEMDDEEVYEGIVNFAEDNFESIADERIEGIRFAEHSDEFPADELDLDVGELVPMTGERIEAILHEDAEDRYLICTPSRGVREGLPIVIESEDAKEIRHFD